MVSSLVYFFRLTYYVMFDFYKNYKVPLYVLLINKRVFLDHLRLSTTNQALGLAILFTAAFGTGVFFCCFYSFVSATIDYSYTSTQSYATVLESGMLYFMQYFYFYFLYFVIVGVLIATS